MFIIRRKDGKMVSRPGSEQSYTTVIEMARMYRTREEAEKDLCKDNERIEDASRSWLLR